MINLKTRSIKNQQTGQSNFYPAVSYAGTIGRDELCELITSKTTFTPADVKSTLCVLEEVIANHLRNGGSVRLGALGSFRTTIKSNEGKANKDEVKAIQIKAVRTVFTPSATLKSDLSHEARFNLLSR